MDNDVIDSLVLLIAKWGHVQEGWYYVFEKNSKKSISFIAQFLQAEKARSENW